MLVYTARSAWMIFRRAARTDGKKPPSSPISREKPSASMKRQWEKSAANNELFKN